MAEAVARLSGVKLEFAATGGHGLVRALDGIDLAVARHEFVALVGPSGCGKSSILRLLADLEHATAGTVEVCGGSPEKARRSRRLSMVFQEPGLLGWRRIVDNVALPFELAGLARGKRRDAALDLIDRVGLTGFAEAYPHQLSGGMRQRAAIARAMAGSPELLLMDEPFSALDEISRDRLNVELANLHETQRMAIVFVTHSIREAALLSDRIVIMSQRPGRIIGVIDNDLPRPRTLATRRLAAFDTIVHQGTDMLERAFAFHGG
jgi:NitT/TauT family transport system ATP-binding protein